MASPLKLLRESGLIRHNLVIFAIVTAVVNGIVTASVGAWLAQTYASHQARRQSVQGIADLIYERRARAGMVISTLRRGADTDELRYRKRTYDEVFVEWNKRIQNNVLQVREVVGARETSAFERLMQDLLVPALTQMDGCLTKAYDVRLAGQDPMPVVEACRFQLLHQFTLDCAKGLTDELFRMTRLSFTPFTGHSRQQEATATERVREACTRSPELLAPPPAAATAPPKAQPADTAPVSTGPNPAVAPAATPKGN